MMMMIIIFTEVIISVSYDAIKTSFLLLLHDGMQT